jgi:hypothetical protein
MPGVYFQVSLHASLLLGSADRSSRRWHPMIPNTAPTESLLWREVPLKKIDLPPAAGCPALLAFQLAGNVYVIKHL